MFNPVPFAQLLLSRGASLCFVDFIKSELFFKMNVFMDDKYK